MRKLSSILLLSIFVFSNTALRELGKVGVLIGHFQEHRALDSDITLLEFLQIHYFNGDVHDADYDRDMQLPFKILDLLVSASFMALPPAVPQVSPVAPIFVKKQIAPCDQSLLPNSHLSDIWQPPKFC